MSALVDSESDLCLQLFSATIVCANDLLTDRCILSEVARLGSPDSKEKADRWSSDLDELVGRVKKEALDDMDKESKSSRGNERLQRTRAWLAGRERSPEEESSSSSEAETRKRSRRTSRASRREAEARLQCVASVKLPLSHVLLHARGE